jgi:hypothetical protein
MSGYPDTVNDGMLVELANACDTGVLLVRVNTMTGYRVFPVRADATVADLRTSIASTGRVSPDSVWFEGLGAWTGATAEQLPATVCGKLHGSTENLTLDVNIVAPDSVFLPAENSKPGTPAHVTPRRSKRHGGDPRKVHTM